MSKFLIHLEDIKPKIFRGKVCVTENIFLKLRSDINNKLFQNAIEISPNKTLQSLAKILNLDKQKLSLYKRNHPMALSYLRKLSFLLTKNGFNQFSLRFLEKNIELIQSKGSRLKICEPRFPLNFAPPEGVRIISKLFHDGGITKTRRPFYSNSEEVLIKEFCDDVVKLFRHIDVKIFKTPHEYLVILSKVIGDILEVTGCSTHGDKVLNNPKPPKWLKKIDKILIREFLRVAMDDEGSVAKKMIVIKLANDVTKVLSISLKKNLKKLTEIQRTKLLKIQNEINSDLLVSNILKFDHEMFRLLNFKVSEPKLTGCYFDENGNIHVAHEFYLCSRNEIARYNSEIGFKLAYKKENLDDFIMEKLGTNEIAIGA